MELKVRRLGWGDTFKLSKILKKMNLKIDTSEIANKIDPTQPPEKVGLQAILPIFLQALENLHLAEVEINDFLGSLVGISGQQFDELSMEEGLSVINQLASQKGIADFLKSAGR